MATAGARHRGKDGPGAVQWLALGGAALVVLGLTFTLGILVGRQWARHTPPPVAGEPTRKAAPTSRRSGLTEVGTERAPQLQEKLTFYQTLTAPLGAVPPPRKGDAPAKPGAAAKARANPGRAPGRSDEPAPPRPAGTESQETTRPTPIEAQATDERQEARAELPFEPKGGRRAAGEERQEARAELPFEPKGGRRAAGEERQEARAEWTVQVGVFKSSQQAESVRKQLAAGGFAAQVTPMTADEGQLRYRVRVGAFRTREAAIRTAERVRSDRSLPTFVTAK